MSSETVDCLLDLLFHVCKRFRVGGYGASLRSLSAGRLVSSIPKAEAVEAVASDRCRTGGPSWTLRQQYEVLLMVDILHDFIHQNHGNCGSI